MADAPLEPVDLAVVDTNTADWDKFPIPEIGAELDFVPLITDSDTGMMVLKMTYKAGFTNPWHTHPCAHGVYVLEGTLTTHQGNYPAGSFVWFPEGGKMHHGASSDGAARSCSSPTSHSRSTTWIADTATLVPSRVGRCPVPGRPLGPGLLAEARPPPSSARPVSVLRLAAAEPRPVPPSQVRLSVTLISVGKRSGKVP